MFLNCLLLLSKTLIEIGLRQFCQQFFFEKWETKSKEQNSGKIGENFGKWVSENYNVAYFALQRWRYSTRIVTNRQYNIMLLEKAKRSRI